MVKNCENAIVKTGKPETDVPRIPCVAFQILFEFDVFSLK